MEKTIKKMKLLLYICLAMILLNSCTEEKEYLENNNRDLKLSRKPFKELLSLKDFNLAYQKVKNEKQRSIASRSAIEDEYNFTIVEGKDVKIVEVDNKTFYNILIQRDSASAAYFENLLLMVEKNNNIDDISAYIVKYEVPDTSILINPSTIDKDITTLFGRVAQTCYTACTPICITPWGDGSGAGGHMMLNGCTFHHLQCSEICVSDQIIDGSGLGGGGGGGEGTPPSDPSPPPSGASGAAPPPELLIDPVFEEEEPLLMPDPCDKIKSQFNKMPTLKEELLELKTKTSDTIEHGKYYSTPSSVTTPNPINDFPPGVSTSININLNPTKKYVMIAHTHNSPSNSTYSIFSWDDLTIINNLAKNNKIKVNEFVFYVITADETIYALTIEDTSKLDDFFYSPPNIPGTVVDMPRFIKIQDYFDIYYNDQTNGKINVNNTNNANDLLNFLKFMKQADLGLSISEVDSTFTNFKKLELNSNNTEVIKTPCNP